MSPRRVSLAVIFLACGSAATLDAGTNSAVWPANAESLVATSQGGYFLRPCTTADGDTVLSSTWQLTLTTRVLEYSLCGVSENPASVIGTRTLTEDELETLLAALRALKPSSRTTCGVDAPTNRLAVATPSGTVSFKDSFYACQPEPNTLLVDDLDLVFTLLRQNSH